MTTALEDRLAALARHIDDELSAPDGVAMADVHPRRRARIATAAAAAVVVLGCLGVAVAQQAKGDRSPAAATAATLTEATTVATSVTSPTSGADTPSTPTVPLPTTSRNGPPTADLRDGASGPEVEQLQQRLADLGFQPGPATGEFGELTRAAVWAYQKLVGGVPYAEADGVVTPQLWAELQQAQPISPRRPGSGRHVEVYLPSQTMAVFDDDRAVFISHISSGALDAGSSDFADGQLWCAEVIVGPGEHGNERGTEPKKVGFCGDSWTPGGVYEIYRKKQGATETRLGGMTDPVFFNEDIAIHGAQNVPLSPTSHGAVRIPLQLAPALYDLTSVGDTVYVFDGAAEPETYGAQAQHPAEPS